MDSTMWLWIALGIVVVGLIVAGVGVGLFIAGAKEPLKEMKESVDNLKERVDRLMLETTNLQHKANELKEDIGAKSEKIGQLVDAGKGTMNSFIDLNSTVKVITKGISSSVSRDGRNAAEVRQWTNTTANLLSLWQELKYSRKSTPDAYLETAPLDERE